MLYGRYPIVTQYNLESTVRMQGVNASYKQALTFLPRWARGASAFANVAAQRLMGSQGSANFPGFIPRTYNWGVNLTSGSEPVRLQGVRLSAHAFQMLGVEAAAGRLLTEEDDDPTKPRVVVLSYALWQRLFGREPSVVGERLTLNGDTYTVAGVLPGVSIGST